MRLTTRIATSAAVLAALATSPAHAADWKPSGPITLSVAFGAGGITDTLARLLAGEIKKNTGWNMVVKNRPGGGGVAMFAGISRAKPDGLNIGIGVNMPIVMQLIVRPKKIPFKMGDFDYLGTVVWAQLAVIAPKDAPYSDMKSFIAHAKKSGKPVKVSHDTRPQVMIMKAIARSAGFKVRMVPHKSGAEQMQSLLGGHVDLAFGGGAHIPYYQAGKIKVLGSVNRQRHGYAPAMKTLIEQGFNFYVDPYFYIAAPKGLKPEVRSALSKAIKAAVNSEKITTFLANSMKTKPTDLGPEGTKEMMSGTEKTIRVLLGATKKK